MTDDPPRLHPVNGLLRLALELGAFVALAWWAGGLSSGVYSWVVGAVVPIAAASAWGVFNVPGDPSRSGRAPVVVPGWLRLLIEVVILGGGAFALAALGRTGWATTFAVTLVVHYVWYRRRIRWLLSR